ncbi:TIGR04086 family membrane protein, partial [Bacillus sp. LR--39]
MNEPKQVGKGILYSLVVIFALMFAGSLLISLLLTFTSLTESSFSWLITAISFITLFIGGFIAGGKSKEKGWLSGGLTALCFSLTVLLFQYLGFGEAFNLKQLLYHSGFLGVSMLGGV